MPIKDKWVRREILEILLYLFIGILMVIILPLAMGLSLKGFEESFVSGLINISSYLGTYLVYVFFMIGAFLLVIFPIASLIIIRKGEHPATQEKPKWYRIFTVSYIFNPEDSLLWRLSEGMGLKGNKNFMKWSLHILRVFMLAILLFGFLGILQVRYPALNVVGTPAQAQLEQQITPTADVIFGAGIPSFSENGFLFLVFFFLLGIGGYICAKFIKDKKTALIVFFIIALLLIAPFMGLFWMSLHSIVHGNSQASLFATFLFGWLGATMTILTGVFIWWLVWHFMNNFFIKLVEMITIKEDIGFIAGIILVLIAVFYIGTEIYFWRRRKRKGIPQT